MKLQRSTWILVVSALILGGVVYVSEVQWTPKPAAKETKGKRMFDLAEEDIQGIIIQKDEETLEFVRTDNNSQPWQMKQPEDVPASDATVSFLLNLLVNGKKERSFTISPEKKQEYGLQNPLAKVIIKLERETHELVLGAPTLSNQFIYAFVDSKDNNEVSLVQIDLQYAIEKELEEWKKVTADDSALGVPPLAGADKWGCLLITREWKNDSLDS